MFYSFVYVQLNVFLFSQILQGYLVLHPFDSWGKWTTNWLGKKNKRQKKDKHPMSKCPGSLPQVQTPRQFHDTLVMPPYGRTPCKDHLWPVFDMKLKSYMETWKLQELGQCQSEKRQPRHTWALLCPQLFFTGPQGYMRHDHHHLKDSFWARAPPGCIRRLSCRRITNAVSRCWVNKYSCWSGILQFLETSTFGPQEAFQLPSLQINPRLLLSKPIPRVLQIRVFLLSQRKNESGVLFSLCLEESVIMQVTIFNIDILT